MPKSSTTSKGDKILAIFDFCESIVQIQSIPPFLAMIARENPNYKPPTRFNHYKQRIIKKFARFVLHRTAQDSMLHRFCQKNAQEYTYPELAGFPLEIAEEVAREYASKYLPHYVNKQVLQKLAWHKEQRHDIVVVSGGLGIYIEPFMAQFGITNILAVQLESITNRHGKQILSGNRSGLHTMEHRKLYALDSALDLSQYDLARSYAYSDCPSDIPLLSLVGNPHAVESSQDMQWARILGYTIIPAKPQS